MYVRDALVVHGSILVMSSVTLSLLEPMKKEPMSLGFITLASSVVDLLTHSSASMLFWRVEKTVMVCS